MKTSRIGPYEAGWLTMLVARGLATNDEANAAMHRVAVQAAKALERRRKKKRRPE